MAQRQVREILVTVDTKGEPSIKKLSKELATMNKSVKESANTLSTLKNAFFAIQGFSFAGLGIGSLVTTLDGLQKLGDRLALTEGSVEGAQKQLRLLAATASDTSSSIEDIATIYNRLNLSLREAGLSSNDLVNVTKVLQNTFRLSGATATEATNAVIQLSQGLASGQVRGQELRSVLEANGLIGEILAKQLGVTRGELLKFAEKEGGIKAAEVLLALANNMESVNERAKTLSPTISESLTINLNKLKVTLDETNKEFGISEKVVSTLNFAFENLNIALTGLGIFGAVKLFGYLSTAGTALLETLATLQVIGVAGLGAALGALAIPIAAVTTVLGSFYIALFKTEELSQFLDDSILNIGNAFESLKVSIGLSTKEATKGIDQFALSVNQTKIIAKDAQNLFDTIAGNNVPLKGLFEGEGEGAIQKDIRSLKEAAERMDSLKKIAFDFRKELLFLNASFLENSITASQYNNKLKELKIKDINEDFAKGNIDLQERNKRLKELSEGKYVKATKEFQINLAELNREFEKGNITLSQYQSTLRGANIDKLNKQLKEGKTNVLEFNSAIRDAAIVELNESLNTGTITAKEYGDAVNEIKLDKLNEDVQANIISMQEYDKRVLSLSEKFQPGSALRTGVQGYIESSGTLSENIAKGIENTFFRLEDTLFDFIKTGKFAFADFTKAILDDLTKIIIRAAIIRPIANGILGSTGLDSVSAKGNVFDSGGIKKFATGGIVSSPTLFGYGSGKTGLMGEAGAEAIMPLGRNSKGELGVKAEGTGSNVVVNVFNQAAETETTQTERTSSSGEKVIDIYIKTKVKESFSDGSLDKTLNVNYGLKRRSS